MISTVVEPKKIQNNEAEETLNLFQSTQFVIKTKLFKSTITNKEMLELDCDIPVLAAVSNLITVDNALKIIWSDSYG